MTDDRGTDPDEYGSVDRRAVLTFLGGLGAGGLGAYTLADRLLGGGSNPASGAPDANRTTPVDCETPTPRRTTEASFEETATPQSPDEPTDPSTIVFAADAPLVDSADALNRVLHDAGLDRSITVEPVTTSYGVRRRQIRQRIEAGEPDPALFMTDARWTMPFITRGQVPALPEFADAAAIRTVREEYFDPLVSTVTGPDGGLYGQPLFALVPTVHYRKDLLRAAGYGDGDFRTWRTDPPTWKTFAGAVDTARREAGIPGGFSFQAQEYVGLACCTFVEFMSGWGGAYFGDPSQYLFGPVGDRPVTVDEQPVLDAIRMVRSFVHGPDADHTLDSYPGISPTGVLEWTEEPSRRPFTEGETVAHRNWPYSIEINTDPEQFGSDLGAMPVPYAVPPERANYPMTGGPTAALGGWHVVHNPNSSAAKGANAARVLGAMRTDSFQRWAFAELGWLPPRPSLYEEPSFRRVEPLGPYLDTLRVGGENAVPQPVTRVWPRQSDAVSTRVHAALAGEQTPEAAMAELKTDLRDLERSAR